MNGGAPAVALRAVRLTPVLVDDRALGRELGRLRAVSDSMRDLELRDPEIVRWTRAWLVAWQGALHARSAIGRVHAWTVVIPRDEWPRLKGDPDHRRRDAAIALLIRTGLATAAYSDPLGRGPSSCTTDSGSRGRFDTITLSERAFVEHRAGLEVDWAAACAACRSEPAALLILRAVVDCVPALDDPGPITLRELALRTDYGEKQVRSALRRLVEAEILTTRDAPGQPTRYRVTDRMLGRVGESSAVMPSPVALDVAAPSRRQTPDASAPLERQSSDPAFRLTLNGATLTLPAGLTAAVEFDADGVPHLRIGRSTGP